MTDGVLPRMRIDKWLWVVRIYKTRTLASAACDQGKVLLLGHSVKPSRLIQAGDEIHIKRTGLVIKLKVLKLSQNRLNPKKDWRRRIARLAFQNLPSDERRQIGFW